MAVETELNLALTKVNIWAQKWLVTFNATKTVYMTFSNSSGKNDLNLALNNVKIEKVNCHKHFGIILNDRLSWTDHIDFVCKKASKKLGLLNKNKNAFSRNVLIKLYKSTILPVIEYGSVLYDDMSLNLSSKVKNIHRRAAIICTGAMPRTETHKLLSDIG